MFEFQDCQGVQKALAEGPWSIDGFWLNFKEGKSKERLEDINFELIQVWVQIHGLVRCQMVADNAVLIGSEAGRVMEVDEVALKGNGSKSVLRFKVELRVNSPLVRGVASGPGKDYWVDFKYERLFGFCYNCGKLNHTERVCVEEKSLGLEKRFSANLRTPGGKGMAMVLNARSKLGNKGKGPAEQNFLSPDRSEKITASELERGRLEDGNVVNILDVGERSLGAVNNDQEVRVEGVDATKK